MKREEKERVGMYLCASGGEVREMNINKVAAAVAYSERGE